MNEYLDMNYRTRKTVKEFAQERNLPVPGKLLNILFTSLLLSGKMTAICQEIDNCIDRSILIDEMIQEAKMEGNEVTIGLLQEQLNEEGKKLRELERMLDREGPVKRKAKEGEITDDTISRAREYPFEDLLPTPLKRGRCACPIHHGNNEQAFLVRNNYGKCYNCGWHGDTIKYLMDTEGLTFLDAVRRLT